jgi:hypothetical protein
MLGSNASRPPAGVSVPLRPASSSSLTGPRGGRQALRTLVIMGVVLGAAGPATSLAMAADGPTMEARILLNGNARIGSWMAIEVHLVNTGPAISGELRLAGGSQGQTRFGRAVDLPTQSDKTYLMYAQPPAFGSELEIVLAADEQKVASTKAKFSIHDVNQLVVAVVAERPEGICACCLTRTKSPRWSCRSRPRTCPSVSKRGTCWTGSSGRTSTRAA